MAVACGTRRFGGARSDTHPIGPKPAPRPMTLHHLHIGTTRGVPRGVMIASKRLPSRTFGIRDPGAQASDKVFGGFNLQHSICPSGNDVSAFFVGAELFVASEALAKGGPRHGDDTVEKT